MDDRTAPTDPLQLGQHFLRDQGVIKLLVDAAHLSPADLVFEPGCGTGSITREIAGHCKVVAVEQDASLVLEIPDALRAKVESRHGNALDMIKDCSFSAVVANPPFGLVEPLLRRLLPKQECARIALLVPASFAALLASDTKWGVLTRAVCALERVAEVPSSAFYPAPDTACVIITLVRRSDAERDARDRVLASLVMQHDKKIKNALEKYYAGTFTKREVAARCAPIGEIAQKGILSLSEEGFLTLLAALPFA